MSASEVMPAWFLSDDPRTVIAAASSLGAHSRGRVQKPETINRRTGKPERGGLHCAKIFGPVEDYRCLCGKYAAREHAGTVCEKCGVLCGERKLRDECWGHIESEVPLIHPRLAPRVAAALGCDVRGLEAVIRCEATLRDDGRVTPLEEERRAHGVRYVAERLGALKGELTVSQIPVTPPDWRNTRNDPQDLAYMGLINRCNRLSRLIELDAPQIILDNEERMTQLALEKVHQAVRAELKVRGPVSRAPATPRAEALLRAIYDDPDDDRPRRAYAEFLTEHGDPRGEFIRRQLATAKYSRTPKPERDALRRNLDVWLAPLAAAVIPNAVFRRGFPAVAKTLPGARAMVDDPAWTTIEHLDTDIAELLASPALRSLRSLVVPYRSLLAVCEGPTVLHRVETLTIRMPGRPLRVEAVTRGEALPAVRSLTLIHAAKYGGLDPGRLAGTALAGGLERLTIVVPEESLEQMSLPEWVGFLTGHPRLERLDVVFGKRLLTFELRRVDGQPSLRVVVSRMLLERLAIGVSEVLTTLGRVLTAIAPYELPLVHVDGAGYWYGEEMAALVQALRSHFGPSIRLPHVWT
jgi:uncharacterized protein (TIGR02996 family)